MNHFAKEFLKCTALAAIVVFAGGRAHAMQGNDEASLARGSVPDRTPEQKYQSAIREAGGAYKEAQRDCAQSSGEEKKSCYREAKAQYDRDMADARRIRQAVNGDGQRVF